jgi:hypothetical protein
MRADLRPTAAARGAAALLAACAALAAPSARAQSPLLLPAAEAGPPLLGAAEAAAVRKEAEALKRKAGLLKEAADKKYGAAAELRQKAGGHRSEAARKGEALRGQAAADAQLSSDLGDLFGMLTSMGGAGGGLQGNSAVAASLTGRMIEGQKAADAKGVSAAHAQASGLTSEADRKAGPLELRADELEGEGNRLMQAHVRLIGVANARFLLLAADELARKAEADARGLERLRAAQRALLQRLGER